ncbi:MAG: hypothetical protein V1663_00985 [archaeon]
MIFGKKEKYQKQLVVIYGHSFGGTFIPRSEIMYIPENVGLIRSSFSNVTHVLYGTTDFKTVKILNGEKKNLEEIAGFDDIRLAAGWVMDPTLAITADGRIFVDQIYLEEKGPEYVQENYLNQKKLQLFQETLQRRMIKEVA